MNKLPREDNDMDIPVSRTLFPEKWDGSINLFAKAFMELSAAASEAGKRMRKNVIFSLFNDVSPTDRKILKLIYKQFDMESIDFAFRPLFNDNGVQDPRGTYSHKVVYKHRTTGKEFIFLYSPVIDWRKLVNK